MKPYILFALGLPILCLAGCVQKNPYDTTPVTGTVLMDEKPMDGVSVTFAPVSGEGQAAGGMTDTHGRFKLTVGAAPVGSGALEGEYHVTFTKQRIEGQELNFDEYKAKFGDRPAKMIQLVPEKYSDPQKSGIAPVKVEKGQKNAFEFNLSTS